MRHRSYMDSSVDQDRERGGDIKVLASIWPYLKPYLSAVVGASVALLVAATTFLALGQGLKFLVDEGFGGGGTAVLDKAFVILLGVVVLLAVATYARFFWFPGSVKRLLRTCARPFSGTLCLSIPASSRRRGPVRFCRG